jgi:hypothetical protein
MSVYITKMRRDLVVKQGVLFGGYTSLGVKLYKGVMPVAPFAAYYSTGTCITSQRGADLLCTYSGIILRYTAATKTYSLLTSANAVNATGTGTASWFIIRPTPLISSSTEDYDYSVSDSVVLSGNVGMLQLNSLSFVSGSAAPLITDFAVSFA